MADGGASLVYLAYASAAVTAASAYSGYAQQQEAQKAQAATEAVVLNQMEIAVELHDYWKESYLAIEEQKTFEIYNDEKKVVDHRFFEGKLTSTLGARFSTAYQEFSRSLSRVNYGELNPFIIRGINDSSQDTLVDLINYSYRFAEHITQATNDHRWAKMVQMMGVGRGALRDSLDFQNAAVNTFSSVGANATNNAENAMYGVGYMLSRNKKNGKVPNYKGD